MHTDLKNGKRPHRRMRLKMQLDASLFMKKNQVDTSSFAGISPKRILLN